MSERDDAPRELREQSPQYPVREWPPDDEISLFDIWDALVRRRWLIIGTAAVVTALAVVYAALQPDTYAYRTAVELGIQGEGGDDRLVEFVEPPAAVQQKIEQAYIPAAQKKVATGEQGPPKVELHTETAAADEARTGVFVLETVAQPNKAGAVATVHETIVDKLEASHAQRMAPVRHRAEARLEKARAELEHLQRDAVERARFEPLEQAVSDAERRLEALESKYRGDRLTLENKIAAKRRRANELVDQQDRLETRLERVDERVELTEEQLASVEGLIDELDSAWVEATRTLGDSGEAMTVLTVGSQLADARARADELEQRLRVGLPDRRDELRGKLQDNRRAQDAIADDVESLKNRLTERREQFERNQADAEQKLAAARTKLARERANYERQIANHERAVSNAEVALDELRPTQALFTAERSIDPVGTSGALIAGLGMVLGGMLGVFAGFFAEFVSAARRRHEAAHDNDPRMVATGEQAIERRDDAAA